MERMDESAVIQYLRKDLEYYKRENRRLEETNAWMHDLIWRLYGSWRECEQKTRER